MVVTFSTIFYCMIYLQLWLYTYTKDEIQSGLPPVTNIKWLVADCDCVIDFKLYDPEARLDSQPGLSSLYLRKSITG